MKSEKNAQFFSKILSLFSILLFLLLPTAVTGKCDCNISAKKGKSQSLLIKYKLAAIGSILTAGGVGVSIPLVGRRIKVLRPENDIFFMIKAFAAGVILATGFIHILPDAFRVLNSPCLDRFPWTEFPFAGMVAMAAAIATLMIDTWATSFFNKKHLMSPKQVDNADEESLEVAIVNSHDSATATATATASSSSTASDLLRQRIISQVLELGIVVHSLVIGITMGTSQNVATIKPLLIALSFHQFFEGMGLGGCISQAQFKSVSTTVMAVFFSLTAPVGIGIGIGISSSYKQGSNSTTASSGGGGLIVEGILESASAGILIYTALVDLLAADFMNTRMQNNTRLLLGAQVSLLLGAGCMSILARWA